MSARLACYACGGNVLVPAVTPAASGYQPMLWCRCGHAYSVMLTPEGRAKLAESFAEHGSVVEEARA